MKTPFLVISVLTYTLAPILFSGQLLGSRTCLSNASRKIDKQYTEHPVDSGRRLGVRRRRVLQPGLENPNSQP